MKKVVKWTEPVLQKNFVGGVKPRTFKELWDRGQKLEKEQQEAFEYMNKAMPVMVTLLEYKLMHREPLVVMRPLVYQTSDLESKQDEDGFYNVRKSGREKFVDVKRTIMPWTQLLLKGLDPTLQEFIFEDGTGKEHSISYMDRDKLLTQTSIFEEIKAYFEGNKGEQK